MFLFLSKLLPLLIYPLGLITLLLLIATVLLWKRPRLAAIPIVLSIAILLLSSSAWVSDALVKSLESQYLPSPGLPQADAIVVLGGCTKSALPPRPWVEVSEAGDRLLYAAKLYREGKAPRVILSGGRIDWQGPGNPESADMAELLAPMGVPKSAVLQDPSSLNTRENAVNVKRLMQSNGIQRILLVTSAIHMPRSMRIFRKLGIEAIPAPTDFYIAYVPGTDASPEATLLRTLPDAGHLEQTTRALREYVGTFIYWLRGWA
jgi:uncharacterized SAM-binding protein YcdF (DUF218 family)